MPAADVFADGADAYETWYESGYGRRAEVAERRLLDWLFEHLDETRVVLEVGCGTGRFSRFMAEGHDVIGLDISSAMLAQCRGETVVARGDACCLPFAAGSVDVTVFVTALEFVSDVEGALREAVRVSRHGVHVIALNRSSIGAIRRKARAGRVTAHARDLTLNELMKSLAAAAGNRFVSLYWRSGLFPLAPAPLNLPVPVGDIIGIGVKVGVGKTFATSPDRH